MKPIVAAALAAAFCLLAGCAGTAAAPAGAGGATGGSGVTVFGTIDAGVSGYLNQSGR